MPTLTVTLPESLADRISQDFSQAQVGTRPHFIYHTNKAASQQEPTFTCVIPFQSAHGQQVASIISQYEPQYTCTITPSPNI